MNSLHNLRRGIFKVLQETASAPFDRRKQSPRATLQLRGWRVVLSHGRGPRGWRGTGRLRRPGVRHLLAGWHWIFAGWKKKNNVILFFKKEGLFVNHEKGYSYGQIYTSYRNEARMIVKKLLPVGPLICKTGHVHIYSKYRLWVDKKNLVLYTYNFNRVPFVGNYFPSFIADKELGKTVQKLVLFRKFWLHLQLQEWFCSSNTIGPTLKSYAIVYFNVSVRIYLSRRITSRCFEVKTLSQFPRYLQIFNSCT